MKLERKKKTKFGFLKKILKFFENQYEKSLDISMSITIVKYPNLLVHVNQVKP